MDNREGRSRAHGVARQTMPGQWKRSLFFFLSVKRNNEKRPTTATNDDAAATLAAPGAVEKKATGGKKEAGPLRQSRPSLSVRARFFSYSSLPFFSCKPFLRRPEAQPPNSQRGKRKSKTKKSTVRWAVSFFSACALQTKQTARTSNSGRCTTHHQLKNRCRRHTFYGDFSFTIIFCPPPPPLRVGDCGRPQRGGKQIAKARRWPSARRTLLTLNRIRARSRKKSPPRATRGEGARLRQKKKRMRRASVCGQEKRDLALVRFFRKHSPPSLSACRRAHASITRSSTRKRANKGPIETQEQTVPPLGEKKTGARCVVRPDSEQRATRSGDKGAGEGGRHDRARRTRGARRSLGL